MAKEHCFFGRYGNKKKKLKKVNSNKNYNFTTYNSNEGQTNFARLQLKY